MALVGAVAVPTLMSKSAIAATSPTLTPASGSPSSGPVGTTVAYAYSYDGTTTDCPATGTPPYTIVLKWDQPDPTEIIGSASGCDGTVSGRVPNDATLGVPQHPTASLYDSTDTEIALSGAQTSSAFSVTPTPTPTPTRTPTPRPTPTPTQRPTPTPIQTVTPIPTVTPKPTPTPTPLPTPTPFVIGGGGGGSGGGTPQGGADCSAGIGRGPTATELEADVTELASTDPTALEIDLLSSAEYYNDAGSNTLGFINRIYDDVLRHDPTPIEIATAIPAIVAGGEAARSQLVEDVVLSPEARAIRVDQVYHALLKRYPDSAELASWVNQLAGPGSKGLSGNNVVETLAGSGPYYTLVGASASTFVAAVYEDLLNRAPTPAELTADASLIAQIQAGTHVANSASSAAARKTVVANLVGGSEFRTDEVTSFFANYLHPTCKELVAQECASSIGVPTSAELANTLTSFQSGQTEEDIIAGALSSPQYYQNHGSSQTGLIKGVYQDLLGRAPTGAEVSAALAAYTNDLSGHQNFAKAMVGSLAYQDLVVSLDYQQLLLRAPLPTEQDAGQGILQSGRSLQTPDELLIEQIASTSEFYADAGGTDSRFLVRAIQSLFLRRATTAQADVFLNRPPPHDSTWQAAVTQTLVDSSEYRTNFINGVYAKFLTYSVCAVGTPNLTGDASTGFLTNVPGGLLGLGIFTAVLLMGIAAVAFFTIERRRFSRMYPNEGPPQHPW